MKELRLLTLGMNGFLVSERERRMLNETSTEGSGEAPKIDPAAELKKDAGLDLAKKIEEKLKPDNPNTVALKNFLEESLKNDGEIAEKEATEFLNKVFTSFRAVGAPTEIPDGLTRPEAIRDIAAVSKLMDLQQWDAAEKEGKKNAAKEDESGNWRENYSKLPQMKRQAIEENLEKNPQEFVKDIQDTKEHIAELQNELATIRQQPKKYRNQARIKEIQAEFRKIMPEYNMKMQAFRTEMGQSYESWIAGETQESIVANGEKARNQARKFAKAQADYDLGQENAGRVMKNFNRNRGMANAMGHKQAAIDAALAANDADMAQGGVSSRFTSPEQARHMARLEREGGTVSAGGRRTVGKAAQRTFEEDMYADSGDGSVKDYLRNKKNKEFGPNDRDRANNKVLDSRNIGINSREFIPRAQKIIADKNYKDTPSYRDFANQYAQLTGEDSDSNLMSKMLQNVIPKIEQELKVLAINKKEVKSYQIDGEGETLPATRTLTVGPRADITVRIQANGEFLDIQPNLQGGLWQDGKARSFMEKHGIAFDPASSDRIRTRYAREGDPADTKSMTIRIAKPGRFDIGGEKIDLRDFKQQIADIKKGDRTSLAAIRSLNGDRAKELLSVLGENTPFTLDWRKVQKGEEQKTLEAFGKVSDLTIDHMTDQSNLPILFKDPRNTLTIRGLRSMDNTAINCAKKVGTLVLPDLENLGAGAGKVLANIKANTIICVALQKISVDELSSLMPPNMTQFDSLQVANLQISSPLTSFFARLNSDPDHIKLSERAQNKIDSWILTNRREQDNAVIRVLKMQGKIGVEQTRSELLKMSHENPAAKFELFRSYAREIEGANASGALVDQWMTSRAFGRKLGFPKLTAYSMLTSAERAEQSRLLGLVEATDSALSQKNNTLSQDIHDIVNGEYDRHIVSLGQKGKELYVVVRDADGRFNRKYPVTDDGDMDSKDVQDLKKLLEM